MDNITQKIKEGKLIPFVGMGVFKNLTCKDGSPLPHDSDSFVLAINGGRAMSARLMYEYTRAAMSLEQRKGRDYLVAMVNHIYTSKEYELPLVYSWLKTLQPPYLIDTNLDDSACKVYEDVAHFMVSGVSRIMGGYDRFVVYRYNLDTKEYAKIDKSELDGSLPILFKPMGGVSPEKNFIVSDADFVDWLTEAMGGYAMPVFLKEYKNEKSYLFMGIDFSRDTYRMVANEITLGLKEGIVLSSKEEITKKERQFFENHKLVWLAKSIESFVKENA